MTVICKVYLNEVRDFGGEEVLVKTSCVADNEVMAMYNKDYEDRLFTTASPSGSADFILRKSIGIESPTQPYQHKLYLVFVNQKEEPAFKDAIAFAPVKVHSCTDFGGTSKQFDIGTYYGHGAAAAEKFVGNPRFMSKFAHRINIDNPGASNQLKPGDADWWVAVYQCDKFTMNEALADAAK